MIYPTIEELTQDKINRYELALATAKCARIITDEYVKQRENAEKSITGNKDVDKPALEKVNREFRDEKAVKLAIKSIKDGDYTIKSHYKDDNSDELEECSEQIAEESDISDAE